MRILYKLKPNVMPKRQGDRYYVETIKPEEFKVSLRILARIEGYTHTISQQFLEKIGPGLYQEIIDLDEKKIEETITKLMILRSIAATNVVKLDKDKCFRLLQSLRRLVPYLEALEKDSLHEEEVP